MRARKLFAALAASATATALLAGCSGGDSESEGVSTAEEVVDGAHPADGEAADPERDPRIGTNTELAEQLITSEDLQEFDPNAKTSELDSETIVKYVEGREAIKDSSEIFGGACDSALDTDVVVDSLLGDAVINRVTFPEAEGEAPKGAGATTVALKPGRLDGFLDRSNYTGCQGAQAPSTEVPGIEEGADPFTVTLGIAVEDLTGVDGVEGFREVRDIVRSNAAGEVALGRNVIIHAYAGDTTIEISYSANSDDVDTNPITAVDNERLTEILSAQAAKLQDA